jgi:hypothetical protein
MKTIIEERERTWYLVKEFEAYGRECRIHKCAWGEDVKKLAPSLNDHFTGYVKVPVSVTNEMLEDVEVHCGVTFLGELPVDNVKGYWVGFDTGHAFDNDKDQNEEYVTNECIKLARQINHIVAERAL